MGITENTIEYLEIIFGELMPEYDIEVEGDMLDFTVMAKMNGFMRSCNIDIGRANDEGYIKFSVHTLKSCIDMDIWDAKRLKLSETVWTESDDYIDIMNIESHKLIIIDKTEIDKIIEWLEGIKDG